MSSLSVCEEGMLEFLLFLRVFFSRKIDSIKSTIGNRLIIIACVSSFTFPVAHSCSTCFRPSELPVVQRLLWFVSNSLHHLQIMPCFFRLKAIQSIYYSILVCRKTSPKKLLSIILIFEHFFKVRGVTSDEELQSLVDNLSGVFCKL